MKYPTFLKQIRFLNKQQDYLVLILIACFWVGLLSVAGTLTSGYHLTDNHEFININNTLAFAGFWKTVSGIENYYFQYRFAPVLFFMRVLMVQLFHLDFLSLSFFWLLLTILTSWLLFKTVNNIGFRRITSVFFTLFIQVGYQSVLCWKLGLGETWGLLYLSVALYFLSKFYLTGKSLYDWLFLIFIIISAACKESFYIFGPITLLVRFYLISTKQNTSFFQTLKQSKLFLAIFITYYLFHFYVAFIIIGTNNIPGAFKADLNFIKWIGFLERDLIFKIIVIGLVLLFASKKLEIMHIKNNKQLQNLILIGVLCILIIVPQLFVYSNLGISERYYIPFTIGLSLVVAYILDQLYQRKWLYFTYMAVLIVGISWQTRVAYRSARDFAIEGKSSNNWIKKAFESSNEKSNFLLVTEPLVYSEWNNSIQIYFNHIGNRKNIYSTEASTQSGLEKLYKDGPLTRSYYDTYNMLYKNMKFREQSAPVDIQCVLIFPELEPDFLKRNIDWFNNSFYSRYESGQFIMYLKK